MAGNQELNDKIAELRQAVVDDQASDQAVVTRLDQIIADLQANADTSAAIAALEEVKTQITTVTSSNG